MLQRPSFPNAAKLSLAAVVALVAGAGTAGAFDPIDKSLPETKASIARMLKADSPLSEALVDQTHQIMIKLGLAPFRADAPEFPGLPFLTPPPVSPSWSALGALTDPIRIPVEAGPLNIPVPMPRPASMVAGTETRDAIRGGSVRKSKAERRREARRTTGAERPRTVRRSAAPAEKKPEPNLIQRIFGMPKDDDRKG